MKRMDLVHDKKNGGWVTQSGGNTVPGTRADTKEEAIRQAAAKGNNSKVPVTLKIHNLDGTIQQERTYPGSADPSRSKG